MTRRATAAEHREDSLLTIAETAAQTALTTLALAGMMMIAAVPPASGQARQSDDTVIQTSASGTSDGSQAGTPNSPQESYRARVRNEMADWRQKMQAFDEKMETRSKGHVDAAEVRLRSAWDDTEVEARNVQMATATATARGWERTKKAYESAAHRMATAWDKARS